MTLDQPALLEVLDALRAAEVGDRVRQAAETIYQALIEAELTAVIGAGRYERSPERMALRNGHRPRTLTTPAGDLELRIPKLRTGSFFPSLLERRRRVDQALFAVVMEAYLSPIGRRSGRPTPFEVVGREPAGIGEALHLDRLSLGEEPEQGKGGPLQGRIKVGHRRGVLGGERLDAVVVDHAVRLMRRVVAPGAAEPWLPPVPQAPAGAAIVAAQAAASRPGRSRTVVVVIGGCRSVRPAHGARPAAVGRGWGSTPRAGCDRGVAAPR
jgi:hypothetical protein